MKLLLEHKNTKSLENNICFLLSNLLSRLKQQQQLGGTFHAALMLCYVGHTLSLCDLFFYWPIHYGKIILHNIRLPDAQGTGRDRVSGEPKPSLASRPQV